ncbi:MAG: substrate-binding domain-containing protein [Candidatus Hydrogenedentes bacterium]|nr:substrate-binding domain-containing protein [Candidatus Hydrogenedentota bacterium]
MRSILYRRAKNLMAGVAVAGLCAAMAGCQPRPKEDDGRVTIGAIVFQEDQYFHLIQQGMRDAADRLKVELMVNNSFGALDKEIAIVDTYLANQVDALVVAPLSPQSSIPALKRAHDKGIPVVTYDAHVDADFPASNIRSDQVELGRITGEAARVFIETKLGGKAKVAIVQYIALAPETASQRVKGFKDEITKLPGVEIVTEQDAWLAPEATSLVENMLTANPAIDLIWAANEGGTVGAVNAAATANKKNTGHHVYVFGTDMSEQIGTFLLSEEDVLQAVTGQKPFDIGAQAITTALAALKKEPVEKKVALPGILFSRADAVGTREYMARLKELAQ